MKRNALLCIFVLVPPTCLFFELDLQTSLQKRVAAVFQENRKKFAGVGTIFIKDGKVLLIHRNNTALNNNLYGLIGGLVRPGESVRQGAIREIKEEIDVIVKPEDLKLVHVFSSIEKDIEVVGSYFLAQKWQGEPKNNEPEKHDRIAWFPLDQLPPDLIERNRQAIILMQKGITYSEYGW